MANLLAVKPLSTLLREAENEGESGLKRALGPLNLITLGIGAIIGAGIFVLTGQAAAKHAGPAVVLSYIVAGITCALGGLALSSPQASFNADASHAGPTLAAPAQPTGFHTMPQSPLLPSHGPQDSSSSGHRFGLRRLKNKLTRNKK